MIATHEYREELQVVANTLFLRISPPCNIECSEYVGGFGRGFITVRRIFQGLWVDFLNSEDEAVNGV
jgi:hypothetical protein